MAGTGTTRRGARRAAQEEDLRRQASLREIRTVGDPVLRQQAALVEVFDERLSSLAEHMIRIMRDAPGVGLAAPQIGVLRRVAVYEVDEGDAHALVNPVITWRSDETEVQDEACLSVPDVTVPVERALAIHVQASDPRGEPLEIDAHGFEARVIQHELDHLDGTLILQRTTRLERARALREMRDNGRAL